MKIARLSSGVASAVIAVGAAGATWGIGLRSEINPELLPLFVGGAVAVVCCMILLPIGWVVDREIDRLAARLSLMKADEVFTTAQCPAWLRPIADAAASLAAQWRQKAEQADSQAREVEIRSRISEADRKHTEAILHSLRDAVLVTDAFNEVVMANEAAGDLLDFDPKEVVHQPIDRVLADENLLELIKDTREAANVACRKHVEHTMVKADGEEKAATFDVTLTCLPNAQQQVGGVVTILHDISHDKEVSELKSDFVSKASHELRTPLSSIRAYIEMLLDGEATDEKSRGEFYEIIQSEANRLGRLIDSMLNISRMEAGIIHIERTSVDFVEVTDEVLGVMLPQADAKSISISRKPGPETYIADADRDMMYQVILNLVSNGVKYTPEGGRVTVIIENDEAARAVLVTVADTGLGIPPDAIDKLFEKFYRVENYKRVAKGSGLGLNLVKHIVETVHSGQIGLKSELGMGSRFWFSIPYAYMGADKDVRDRVPEGETHARTES
ncbi:MAG: PAS domain-containing protein [Phycisphaerales bacterium]|nr:PAS domain-containing protein [Phycisphaerales bacterium]